jgi:hypothetical protein
MLHHAAPNSGGTAAQWSTLVRLTHVTRPRARRRDLRLLRPRRRRAPWCPPLHACARARLRALSSAHRPAMTKLVPLRAHSLHVSAPVLFGRAATPSHKKPSDPPSVPTGIASQPDTLGAHRQRMSEATDRSNQPAREHASTIPRTFPRHPPDRRSDTLRQAPAVPSNTPEHTSSSSAFTQIRETWQARFALRCQSRARLARRHLAASSRKRWYFRFAAAGEPSYPRRRRPTQPRPHGPHSRRTLTARLSNRLAGSPLPSCGAT